MAVIEYYYSAHSAFAYLGSRELMRICRDNDVSLIHRPITLSPVIEAQGAKPFVDRTQAHVDYFFGREIERWAELRKVPIISFRPTYHDADYSVANGMIVALGDSGEAVDAMAHALLEAHWRDDADLSNPATLGGIASALRHDAMSLIARAASNDVKARIEENNVKALELNVFGSPTYVLGEEVFYGQDRLEMLERAISNPFAQSNWRNPNVTR